MSHKSNAHFYYTPYEYEFAWEFENELEPFKPPKPPEDDEDDDDEAEDDDPLNPNAGCE